MDTLLRLTTLGLLGLLLSAAEARAFAPGEGQVAKVLGASGSLMLEHHHLGVTATTIPARDLTCQVIILRGCAEISWCIHKSPLRVE